MNNFLMKKFDANIFNYHAYISFTIPGLHIILYIYLYLYALSIE